MTMFTRRCSRPLKTWRSEFASSFKIFLMLVLVSSFLIPARLSAQNLSVEFQQGANKDNPFSLGTIHWINSILQSSNSIYAEGMSTLQRIVFYDMADVTNDRHVLQLKMEAEKSGHHAYDFMTGWNQALKAALAISPSVRLMPDPQASNTSPAYDESEPQDLRVCGSNISATGGTVCDALHDGVKFDLSILSSGPGTLAGQNEGNHPLVGDVATVAQEIAAYEAAFGDRTIRVWTNGFIGAENDADNFVEFVKYDAGYIFYNIHWRSHDNRAVIEYGAHIARGQGGYGVGQGASDINGGPYHTILVDFLTGEGNLGNQDNQLQGADIVVVPECNITGGQSTVCPGSANLTFNAHPTNLDGATFSWVITHNETGAAIVGSSTDSIVVVSPGTTAGCDSLRFIVTNSGGPVGALSDTCKVRFCVVCTTPTIGSPGGPTTINCTATPSFTAPTGADACGAVTVNNLGDVTGGNSCTRTITRRWDVTNACGNHSGTVSQTITLIDNVAPTIGSPGGAATINCTATPSFTPPTATDACNGATVNNLGDVTGGNSCARTITRRWDATDACGNHSATVSQTITVVDNVAPNISSAGANATINCTAAPSFTPPTASDACDGATVNELGDVTSGTTCNRTITRRWDATDVCGNHSATVSQSITIIDNVPPSIGSAGAAATINCTATPSFTPPTATDFCNGATVNNLGDVTGGNSCNRTITRRWDATDACGNHSATVSQTITIIDDVAPSISSAGAAATINCTATPSFTAPTASDACNGATVNNLGDVTAGNSCNRTITRRWDATDACGNHSATVSQTITIVDNVAPTIGSAGAAATINCTVTPSFTAPTASDACNGATVNNLGDVTGGNSCNRTITRRWDATDACGNHSATVSQTITIVDDVAPTIGSAGAAATINCTAAPEFTPPTASDACNGATVNNLGDVTGGTTCNRTITRRWDATDACGNHSATVSQTITVIDNVAPIIGSAGAAATINCTVTPTFTAPTASDACNGATVNNLGDVTGGNSCNRTITRRWDATDACGNHSATVSQTITIIDNVAPTIGSAGAAATINCTVTPSFTAPTASDACNGATVNNLGDVTGGNSCNRTITRRWDATDACGNHSATVSQTITIIDDVAPTIGSAGAAATINCTVTPSFTAPTASDACNGATVNNLGDVTGGNSCNRTITRRWDATDACGNHSATVSQTITIIDDVAPTIGSAGAAATINCTATPSFTAPTASDACNGATVNNLGDVTGGNSCNRTITRRWDATDACGNHSATVSQTITIIDNVAPTIGSAGAAATINCTVTPTFTAPTASDACNGATVNNLGDVTSGNSCLRTITRRWDATDACGNHSATVSQTITIVDDVAPSIGSAGAAATINCTATPSFTPPTASDACNGATVNNLGDVSSGNSCLRTITRRWDATDACGNHSATVSQTITIIDDVAPTIGAAGAAATINCTVTPTFTAPTASDACNGATVNNLGDVSSGNSCLRTITRRWDATDACGNHSATVSQTITIIDNVAPTIGSAGAAATINCTATPTFTPPTASDACNGATVNNLGDVSSGNSCLRTITRRWDATDACGNHSATVSQTITIVDNVAPTIGSAGAAATINCTATPTFTPPTASDACNGATVNNLGDVSSGNSCLRTITRRWDATDACGNHSATVSQTITIVDNVPPTIGTPGANATIECPAMPSFTPPTASDACNGATVNLLSDVTVAGQFPGAFTQTRTWDATDACGNHSATVSQQIVVQCVPKVFCTFTQGFWGNKNGLAYMRDSGLLSTPIIIGSTAAGKKSILIPAGSWATVNSIMPGGGTPGPLTVAGQCSILNACFDSYLTKQGRINNVLLSQTLALSLNVRVTKSILGLPTFQAGKCLIIEGGDTVELNQSVVNYLICRGTANVAGLLALANDLLGGVLTPGQNVGGCIVPTYGAVNEAVTTFNEAFDECRTFLGFGPCSTVVTAAARTVVAENASAGLTVSSYPNPYTDQIRFVLQSRTSGQGSLEVYNLLGQKIKTVYQGFIPAGKGQVVNYNVPVLNRTHLIYVFKVGDKQVTGKLLNIR